MVNGDALLSKAKTLVESKLCWGNSSDWVNQDFITLSKKIEEETGTSVSHVTLKRLWGKVKYESLPQVHTLNTLVRFVGYESWRDFVVENGHAPSISDVQVEGVPVPVPRVRLRALVTFAVILTCLGAGIILFNVASKRRVNKADYSFRSHATIKAGIPNSVIFDYDATRAPGDSVVIQQSWNTKLQTKVSRNERQHTLIYYFPGFFQPKLIVDGQIVKEQDLLIKSDGWVTAYMTTPVPVYFNRKEVIAQGKMFLSVDRVRAQNISFTPQAPLLSYCNVQDFGEIYSDNFVFETSVRNDYREGSSICQLTNIYLLCKGTAVNIPLCAKGCESSLSFFFTGDSVSGKQKDLSNFGVDFTDFIKIRVASANGKARIFINDKLAYEVEQGIKRSKIIGIDYVFQGTGSVDYARLWNRRVCFDDEF